MISSSKKGKNKRGNDSQPDIARNITAIYGLNLALSYENASVERLEHRKSQTIVPEIKKNLIRHLKQTKEQRERLREGIRNLASMASEIKDQNSAAYIPTAESGRLPIPEPPYSLKSIMDEVGTEREREVWESVNDLIIERSEVIMYRAGITALELLEMDKKIIGILKKNLREEEAFSKWLEKNNPRIAKKLMKEQMREGKRKKGIAEITSAPPGEGEAKDKDREMTVADTKAATAPA